MDNHDIGVGITALFIASICIIVSLWAILKVLTDILNELRRITGSDDSEE
jgi:hypothetical protein